MIPKKIYFFWGNEKMSWMRYMTLKSFTMFNPDWQIYVYTSNRMITTKTWDTGNHQDFFAFNGSDYMDKARELDIEFRVWDADNNGLIEASKIRNMGASHKSNLFKWYMMATEGGIYCDMDVLFFRPIDKFYKELNKGGYTTAICQTEYLSIGLLASAGDDDFFQALFINSVDNYTPDSYQSAGVESIYNLYALKSDEIQWILEQILAKYPRFTAFDIAITLPQSNVLRVAEARYPNLMFYNIPFDLIYSWDANRIIDAFVSGGTIKDMPEDAIGYHWYAGHPLAQTFNNLLTENNYYRINTLFTNIAKEILQ